jgi:hypothetical protein
MSKNSGRIFVFLCAAVFIFLGLFFNVVKVKAAGTVTGSVKNPNGSSAGAGITVVINKTTWPQINGAQASGTTDASGNFSISMNQDNNLRAWVVADSDTSFGNSSSSTVFNLADGETKNVGNLTLTALQFYGRITYPDGSGVSSGSRIEVHTFAGNVFIADELDADGKYSIGGLPAGSNYAWEIQIDSSITYFTKPQGQIVTVTEGMAAQEINASLISAPKHITGQILRQDSTPVDGASVQACPDKNPNLSCVGDHTDAGGSYNLYLSPGAWQITVGPDLGDSSADWVYFGFPETIEFSGEAQETLTKNFTVTPADARITGTVLLAGGTPTLNTDVQCYSAAGRGSVRKTKANGVFSYLLPAGSYRCTFFSLDENGRDQIFTPIKTTLFSGQTVNIGTVQGKERTSHITGRAYLSSGEGVSGVDIVLWQTDGVGKQRVVSGNGGSYDALVTPGKWIVGVENGHSFYFYDDLKEVEVSADNQMVLGVDIRVAQNEATVRGTLRDEAGSVVANQGGAVYIRNEEGNYKFTGQVAQDGSYNFVVPTEMLGGHNAKVYLGWSSLVNADYSFLSEKTTNLVERGKGQNVGKQRFEDVAVDVQVRRDTKTISGGFVDQNGAAVSPNFKMKVMGSDGRGNVRVVDVSNGSYSMAVSEGLWNLTYEILEEGTGYINPVNKLQEAEVNADDVNVSKNIVILKTDAVISGTLLDSDGAAVPHATVYASNHKAVEETSRDLIKVEGETDGQGNYSLSVAGGETYKVGAGSQVGATSQIVNPKFKEAEPKSGDSIETDLQYQESNSKISGQVTKEGKAVSDGFVQAWSDEGGSATAEIGADGRYEINVTKNDHWHLRAAQIDSQFLYVSLTSDKVPSGNSETVNLSLLKSEFKVAAPEVKIFQADEPISLTLSDGTTITAPDKAFDTEGEITLTISPKIDIAFQDFSKPLSLGYDIKAKDSDGKEIISFLKPVSISFRYTDRQLEEFGIDEEQLETNYFDEVNNIFKTTGFATLSLQTNSVTVYTDHFTSFSLASPYAKGRVSKKASIIVTPKNFSSKVAVYNNKGEKIFSFVPYTLNYRGEFETAVGDVNGNKKKEIIIAPGKGMKSYVRVFRVIGKKKKKVKHLSSFYAFGKNFEKGVNLAVTDFDRDKKAEIIVAPAQGKKPVKIYKYDSKKKKFTLFKKIKPYGKNFKGGVNLAVGDVNNDGKEDLVVAPASSATKRTKVKVYIYNANKNKFQKLANFRPYSKKFRSGINLAIGDVNGDKQKELIIVPNLHFKPLMKVYQYSLAKKEMNLLAKYYVFKKSYKNGVNLELGDVNGDGKDEMIVAPNEGYKPQVRVLSYQSKKKFRAKNFRAYKKTYQKGVELDLADVNDNGLEEIVVAPQKGVARVKIYKASGKKAKLLKKFLGFPKSYQSGVNLASGIF